MFSQKQFDRSVPVLYSTVCLAVEDMVLLHDVGITSLCVSLSIFYLRLLNIFSASSLIGPKLVVIGRMVCTYVELRADLRHTTVQFIQAIQAIVLDELPLSNRKMSSL